MTDLLKNATGASSQSRATHHPSCSQCESRVSSEFIGSSTSCSRSTLSPPDRRIAKGKLSSHVEPDQFAGAVMDRGCRDLNSPQLTFHKMCQCVCQQVHFFAPSPDDADKEFGVGRRTRAREENKQIVLTVNWNYSLRHCTDTVVGQMVRPNPVFAFIVES